MKSNDDILFLNEKQQLHIESPSEEDSGHYTCFAENKVGSAEKNVIVTVLRMFYFSTNFFSILFFCFYVGVCICHKIVLI